MIASLGDAWRWYESARKLTLAMQQLGKKHWDQLPWEGNLGRDQRLRNLKAAELVEGSQDVLNNLNDLCILLLFSVFEALVRVRVLEDIEGELPLPRHPALQHAVRNLNENIEHGSFAKVLEAYKGLDADLVEEVNQVRRYRNWVAHGRRGTPQNDVDPRTAYDRLQRFLERLHARAARPPAAETRP